MIFSENRFTPRIKSGASFFGIMRYSKNPASRGSHRLMPGK